MATINNVTTIAAMAALAPSVNTTVFLNQDGREGLFECVSGTVPSDPQQGLYIASNTGGFYWSRVWDGLFGKPEWFGARRNDGSLAAQSANLLALQACVALCPVTVLASADYWINGTFKITTSFRTIRGEVLPYGDVGSGTGTRIISTDGARSVIQVGPDAPPPTINDFLRGIMVENICARWAGTAMTIPAPTNLAAAPKAFDYRFLIAPVFKSLAAWEPLIGHYLYGVVNPRFYDCSAFRSIDFGSNDFYRGFWLQGNPPVLAGGNASVYLVRCNVSAAGSAVAVNIGFYANANFADTYLIQCETSAMTQAVVLDGGGSNTGNGMLDVHILNPIFDQVGKIGIDIVQLNEAATITISGGYIQCKAGAEKAIWARGGAGSVVLTGGLQIICSDGGLASGCFGVRASNQPHLVVDESVTIKETAYSISLDGGCYGGSIKPTIFLSTRPVGSRADGVYMGDCSQMQVAPAIKARAGAVAFEQGVRFGGTNSRIVVDATRIDQNSVTTPIQVSGVTLPSPGFYKPNGAAGSQSDKGFQVIGFVG